MGGGVGVRLVGGGAWEKENLWDRRGAVGTERVKIGLERNEKLEPSWNKEKAI